MDSVWDCSVIKRIVSLLGIDPAARAGIERVRFRQHRAKEMAVHPLFQSIHWLTG